jgi:hypothetical protein
MDCGLTPECIAFLEPAVTLYAILDPKPGQAALPAAIPEQFSWLAAILPPVFLLRHGLWLELVGFVLVVTALVLAAPLIGGNAAFLLYLLGALWLGWAAPELRRAALRRRGWNERGPQVAASADLAQLEALS